MSRRVGLLIAGLAACLAACLVGIGCEAPSQDVESAEVRIPLVPFCESASVWLPELVELEASLVIRINEHRATGAQCGDLGRLPPADPLRVGGAATCASRVHALDMATADFVAHAGSDGSSPWDRLRSAGSRFAVADQVLAAGAVDPIAVVDELWLTRPSSCAALMAPEYERLGVGWARGDDDSTYPNYVVAMPERTRTATQ